jgi:uncharacterized phage-associated protein
MPSIASALDVAAYLLAQRGPMSAIKLQKLVYYSQAWSLVWDNRPLFSEPIHRESTGPMVQALADHHVGKFLVAPGEIPGHREALDAPARDTIDAVLDFYGSQTAQWLFDLIRAEAPWADTHAGAASPIIPWDALQRYYATILNA